MYLIYKIKNYNFNTQYNLENLEFKMNIESLDGIFNKHSKVKYEDLEKYGHCYVYRILKMDVVSQAEYVIINDDFDFTLPHQYPPLSDGQLKKRHDIISLLREKKINDIID